MAPALCQSVDGTISSEFGNGLNPCFRIAESETSFFYFATSGKKRTRANPLEFALPLTSRVAFFGSGAGLSDGCRID